MPLSVNNAVIVGHKGFYAKIVKEANRSAVVAEITQLNIEGVIPANLPAYIEFLQRVQTVIELLD